MTNSPAQDVDDAARWWEAYCLAENAEADELARRAEGGDDHARRQLASWLGERGRAREAAALIRPLADAGDDVAQLWLARWLAETAEVGDLRQRADGGDYHAQQELPGCLAESGHLDELRQRAEGGDDHALQVLAGWLADHRPLDELRELITAKEGRLAQLRRTWQSWQGDMDVISVLADLGDDRARRQLAHHGSREELRQRAAAGDEYARERLAELPGE